MSDWCDIAAWAVLGITSPAIAGHTRVSLGKAAHRCAKGDDWLRIDCRNGCALVTLPRLRYDRAVWAATRSSFAEWHQRHGISSVASGKALHRCYMDSQCIYGCILATPPSVRPKQLWRELRWVDQDGNEPSTSDDGYTIFFPAGNWTRVWKWVRR